jgi:type II secretory pathway component PulF
MTLFSYTALSSDGKPITGTLPADSRAAAIAAIAGKGLHPVKVQEQNAKTAAKKTATPGAPKAGRVTGRQIENFTRELASLLAGGVPLARSLHLLRRESKAPAAQFLLNQIHDDVVGGASLADTLAQHPKQFSTIYVAMVRAGEAGGFLDVVLNQIAEFRSREQDLKGKVKAALIYPAVLGVMAVGIVVFLMVYFIPTFSSMFSAGGATLPKLTHIVLWISNVMASRYSILVLAILAVGIYLLRAYIKTDRGRRRAEAVVLRTPVLGNVISVFSMVRFSRLLGTLLGAGVPLVSSLKVAKESIANRTLSDSIALGIEEVQRGESLARALGSADRLFPSTVVEMIAIAEETGRLDKELVRLSQSYESELDRQLRMLVALAEPLMLFIMAGIIGTIVVAMLLPIFSMGDLLK